MKPIQFLAFWQPSFAELMIIMIIALLLFGKRLPDVARSLGKGVVEFKKGLKGIEDDAEQSQYQPPRKPVYTEEKSGPENPANPAPPPAAK